MKLALFLEGQPQPYQQSACLSGPTSTNSDHPWQRRCMWCDSVEHTRRDCTEFTEALNAKQVGFNELGRIKLMSMMKLCALILVNKLNISWIY